MLYKEKLEGMIIKGVIGFIIGFTLACFAFEAFDFWGNCIFGLIFAGAPYGWELFGKVLGGLTIIGGGAVLVCMFMLRLFASIILGWIAYPIALIYYIIKHTKNK